MNYTRYPYVFLDLDETLIHTRYSMFDFSYKRENEFIFELGGYNYGTVLHPFAKKLIEFIRSFSIARILTAATADYSNLICKHFGLDFDADEIISRNNYVEWVQDGYSGFGGGARETAIAKMCINHHNAILVDNQTPDLPNAVVKMEYLGIYEKRYVVFPEYDGTPETVLSKEEFENIKSSIKRLYDEAMAAEKG